MVRKDILFILITALGTLIICSSTGCSGKSSGKSDNRVTIWAHQGQEEEVKAIQTIIDSFNVSNPGITAELKTIPSGDKHSYEDKVNAASIADQLPDVLDLDGPFVARYAWANILQPLDRWFTEDELADFLPSIINQGTYNDALYALGAFESSVCLYYNADLFEQEGIAVPKSIDDAWDWETFASVARTLTVPGKRRGVSFKMDYGPGEWFTYGFTPLLWSAGEDILSPDRQSCTNYLNSKKSVEVLTAFRKLFIDSIATASPAPDVFETGGAAMEWNGHWVLRTYEKIDDFTVGVMPLPRTGEKQKTPCGSWCWGITRNCKNIDNAVAVLKWITGAKTGVIPMVRANGAPPARHSVYKELPEYSNYPRQLFYEQLQKSAQPRPAVPFYPVLSAEFSRMLADITLGADVQKSLENAAQAIDLEINRGRYYK